MLQPIDTTLAVEAALEELDDLLSGSGAVIQHEELPIVHGHAAQLTSLFATLLRHQIGSPTREAMLRGSIRARFDSGGWQFTVQVRDLANSKSLGSIEGADSTAETCRQILDRHGGRLEGLSKSSNAHCAIFRLPAAPRQELTPRAEDGTTL